MSTITVEFAGMDKALAGIEGRGERVASAIQTEMTRLTIKMSATVKDEKLSGQVLHRRTGTLSRSVHHTVERGPQEIHGKVLAGKDAPYGRMHEYGFQGTESVRAHSRVITQVFGHPISPMTVAVSGHSRAVNIPVRSFLRSTLHEMETQIKDGLRAAVRQAIR